MKKTGKSITDIEFTFNRPKAAAVVPTDATALRLLERLTSEFRLRKDQAEKILAKFPAKDITRTLYDISLKKKCDCQYWGLHR